MRGLLCWLAAAAMLGLAHGFVPAARPRVGAISAEPQSPRVCVRELSRTPLGPTRASSRKLALGAAVPLYAQVRLAQGFAQCGWNGRSDPRRATTVSRGCPTIAAKSRCRTVLSSASDDHGRSDSNSNGVENADDDSDALFVSGTAFEFALAGLAIVLGWLLDVNALGAGFDLSPAALAAGLLWTIPPLAFVSCIRLLELEQLREIEAITMEFAQKLFVDRSNAQLALFCFAAGFGEELLFRGVLHQKLEIVFGFFPAAAAVAVGFGAAHFLTPAYFVISGLSSFIFSFMFASSGSNTVVPIISHAVYDFIALKMTLDDLSRQKNEPKV